MGCLVALLHRQHDSKQHFSHRGTHKYYTDYIPHARSKTKPRSSLTDDIGSLDIFKITCSHVHLRKNLVASMAYLYSLLHSFRRPKQFVALAIFSLSLYDYI